MPDDIEKTRERARQEAEQQKQDKPPELSNDFLKKCLYANELGDGALYAAMHKDRFVFNKTAQQWFFWKGHHWDIDIMEKSFIAVEQTAMQYINEANRFTMLIAEAKEQSSNGTAAAYQSLQKKYFQQAKRLRKTSGALNCLAWAHRIETPLAINGAELDCNPWLLACANGTIDLRTAKHYPGRPDDYLFKAVPHEYKGIDEPCPGWEKFISEIMDGNQNLISYIQRCFGYGITGLINEHILPILSGEGRNGKGTLVEVIRYVLGPLAEPIQSEMLMEQKNPRSSAGPSPDIMSLKGLRIAFASEIDEGRKFSPAKAKWLSGGDTLVGRHPNDKYEIRFMPTHLLCLLTNHLPHAPGDDYAFWKRLRVIPFKLHFIDDPKKEDERLRDKNLGQKLKEEASGILAWLVKGCLEWQRQGENPPREVLEAVEQYRFNEDILAEFITECCGLDEEVETKFADIYIEFEKWWLANRGEHPPKKKKVSMLLAKQFKRDRTGGRVTFFGLAVKPEGNRGF